MHASGDGFWELDLADGSAWFSDWFCPRLEQLTTGQTEWWHMRGAAQRSDAGHPTHFAGCVREVTGSRPDEPKSP